MNWDSWLLWGFVATVVLTALATTARHFHLTRMNIPFMLGTLYTENRNHAVVYGLLSHFLNGWIFSLLYVAGFHSWGVAGWWQGLIIGFVHAFFVLAVGLPVLPYMHPRMATERHGPATAPILQPPGFFARNYGRRTPIAILVAHLVYGTILGAFYTLS